MLAATNQPEAAAARAVVSRDRAVQRRRGGKKVTTDIASFFENDAASVSVIALGGGGGGKGGGGGEGGGSRVSGRQEFVEHNGGDGGVDGLTRPPPGTSQQQASAGPAGVVGSASPNLQPLALRGGMEVWQHLVPSVTGIQRLLQQAWAESFDPAGAAYFGCGRLLGKTKPIGATECSVILRYLGLRAVLIDCVDRHDLALSRHWRTPIFNGVVSLVVPVSSYMTLPPLSPIRHVRRRARRIVVSCRCTSFCAFPE